MSLEDRVEKLEKLVNMILDNMSMRTKDREAKNPSEHFKPFLRENDKE